MYTIWKKSSNKDYEEQITIYCDQILTTFCTSHSTSDYKYYIHCFCAYMYMYLYRMYHAADIIKFIRLHCLVMYILYWLSHKNITHYFRRFSSLHTFSFLHLTSPLGNSYNIACIQYFFQTLAKLPSEHEQHAFWNFGYDFVVIGKNKFKHKTYCPRQQYHL